MSENSTNTVGYFNPHGHPVALDISEINYKAELPPGQYVKDDQGNIVNDPIFEPYCHPKGLAKATTEHAVPLRMVMRPSVVATTRPSMAVTQATAFVRQADGRVVPVYDQNNMPTVPAPANKNPYVGMTVERARQLGLIGKPRLIPEDYGADETSGAPERGKNLPGIKISIESTPRIRTSAPLSPEVMQSETMAEMSPEETARRQQLAQSLNRSAQAPAPQHFNPNKMRPASLPPVALKAPTEPTRIVAAEAAQVTRIEPVTPAQRIAPAPVRTKRPTAKRTVVVEAPPPQPIQPIEPEPMEEEAAQEEQPEQTVEEVQRVEALEATDTGAAPEEEGRYVCAADGKPFKFRSELKRYVEARFPQMAEQLMQPYPATA